LLSDGITSAQRRKLLRLWDPVKNQLQDLATSLYKDCSTVQDKINATTSHFKNNYSYALIMPESQGKDPLIDFIQNGKTGYCEYFASAAAILLRLGDVPTRYVTGFYATEKESLISNNWVARNQDAHAWVEAWDEDHQCWRTVEATVQNVLEEDLTNTSGNLTGLQRFAIVQRLIRALYQYGVLGFFIWIFDEGGFVFQFCISLASAVGLILCFRKLSKTRCHNSVLSHRTCSDEQWHMHKLRVRLERGLKRKGIARQPHETLLTFALAITTRDLAPQTVVSIQNWYTQYNHLRYSKKVNSLKLEQLTQALADLLKELKRRTR